MILHLQSSGVLLVLLALLHVVFPRRFNWKTELQALSLINRQLMAVHTFFIAFVVFLMGLLCITSAHELTTTLLGQRIALGLGVFWLVRLFVQFFWYSPALWRGKRFETITHVVFSGIWTYLTVLFFWVSFGQ